jgi:hypothetical protein
MVQKSHQAKTKRSSRGKPWGETRRSAKKIKTVRNGIKNKEVYELIMKEIDTLMKKGEGNLSQKELKRLRKIAEAAENYENTYEPQPVPS